MLGDTETDIRFARNIGVPAFWARYGFGNAETCEALKPERTLAEEALEEVGLDRVGALEDDVHDRDRPGRIPRPRGNLSRDREPTCAGV